MAVQVEQLGRAFSAETEHQFTVWTLATPDPLERALEPGYFARCFSRFRLGDLLVCATGQPPPRAPAPAEPSGRRRSLLMVTRLEPGRVEVRLVQDWGTPLRPARTDTQGRMRRPGLAALAGAILPRRRQRGLWCGAMP